MLILDGWTAASSRLELGQITRQRPKKWCLCLQCHNCAPRYATKLPPNEFHYTDTIMAIVYSICSRPRRHWQTNKLRKKCTSPTIIFTHSRTYQANVEPAVSWFGWIAPRARNKSAAYIVRVDECGFGRSQTRQLSSTNANVINCIGKSSFLRLMLRQAALCPCAIVEIFTFVSRLYIVVDTSVAAGSLSGIGHRR